MINTVRVRCHGYALHLHVSFQPFRLQPLQTSSLDILLSGYIYIVFFNASEVKSQDLMAA